MSPVRMLGLRVVRGPDWNLGSLDGEEGGVGTVVSVEIGQHGRPLPDKSVLVYWDSGRAVVCRAGFGDCYDLRVYDSASAGVLHSQFTCDECGQSGITGMRWHCSECHDYDLCSDCYMDDKHHKNHNFVRFDKPNNRTDGSFLEDRLDAAKVKARGIFPGATVRRGQHLTLDSDQDSVGQVVELTALEGKPRSAVTVQWSDGLETTQRVGYEGKVDLDLVECADGPFYYKDHLPVLEYQSTDTQRDFRVGDQVRLNRDHEIVKKMAQENGNDLLDQVGRIFKIDDDDNVHVAYGPVWTFSSIILQKVELPVQNVQEEAKNDMNTCLKMLFEAFQDIETDIQEVVDDDNKGAVIQEIDEKVDALFNVEAIKQILDQNDDPEMTEQEKMKQLFFACSTGDLERARCTLTLDEDLVNEESKSSQTALHMACLNGNPDVVSFLIENGADVEKKDEEGYTPLHYATSGDATGECVVLMLSANAFVNVVSATKTKLTPLHLAVNAGNLPAVSALIHSGQCDVNYKNASGNTPLHCVVLAEDSSILAEILKVPSLDPFTSNNNGLNALHLACQNNNATATRALINKFPKLIDVRNQDGFTPLHLAVLSKDCQNTKILINEGHCSFDLPDNKGSTALALAVSLSLKDIVEILMECGADVNAVDKDGDTPLHIAVIIYCLSQKGIDLGTALGSKNSSEDKKLDNSIIQSLVVRGADIHLKNYQGDSPLDLCVDDELARTLVLYEQLKKYPSSSKASNVPSHQSLTEASKDKAKDSSDVALPTSSKCSNHSKTDGSKPEAFQSVPTGRHATVPAHDGRGTNPGANEDNQHAACNKIAGCNETNILAHDSGAKTDANEDNQQAACNKIAGCNETNIPAHDSGAKTDANEDNQQAACKKIAEEEVGTNVSISLTSVAGRPTRPSV